MSRKKKKVVTTIESDSAYLYEDDCPQCGKTIEWIRESGTSAYNADCRPCMVIWNAHPTRVTFELMARPARLSDAGAMLFND